MYKELLYLEKIKITKDKVGYASWEGVGAVDTRSHPCAPHPTPPCPRRQARTGAGPGNTLWPGRRKENKEGTQGAGSRPGPPTDRQPRAGVQYSTRALGSPGRAWRSAGMDSHPHPLALPFPGRGPPHPPYLESRLQPEPRALQVSNASALCPREPASLRGGVRLLLQGAHLGRACLRAVAQGSARGLGIEGGREGVVLASPEARPRVPGLALQGPLSASSRNAPRADWGGERAFICD